MTKTQKNNNNMCPTFKTEVIFQTAADESK